jgi:lipopolysaccharide export system permease protein
VTLNRYIAHAFAVRIVVVLLGLLVILQTMDVIGESNRILSVAGNTEADLWRYVQLRIPVLITQFLPFAVLLATLITFGTLAASSQVVIMRSLGLSPHQILAPMITVGAVCAVLHFAWNETVTVHAAARLAQWQATDYGRIAPAADEKPRMAWVTAGDTVIRARATPGPGGGVRLEDVAIFSRVKNGGLDAVLLAERGELSEQGIGLLENVREAKLASRDVETAALMPWRPGITPAYFFDQAVNPDHATLFDLAIAARAVDAVGKDPGALRSALYHKLARPLASLLMPLLGAVVAFGLARTGNVLARAGLGLAFGFAYFIADNVVMAMGRSGALPPSIAAALPVLLFFIVSEAILIRAEN